MPGMPRIKGKPTNIAFAILGKPANLSSKRSSHQQEINQRLNMQDSSRLK